MTAAATQGIATRGFAVSGKDAKFEPFEFARREVGPKDILIDILYAGICHSDIHQVRAEWEPGVPSIYPMVPGHEIVGRVTKVGSEVTKFKEGDFAGSGASSIRAANAAPALTASSSTASRVPRRPTTAPRWTARRRPTAATRNIT
jgi:D-arabinose 1-dehydrogenase-like Zn-dependent alcohol dehydrogenase